jgi:hypothetical protein
MGNDIGTRPMLMVGVVLLLSSVQLITTGILAEMIARTYYRDDESPNYIVRRSSMAARMRNLLVRKPDTVVWLLAGYFLLGISHPRLCSCRMHCGSTNRSRPSSRSG